MGDLVNMKRKKIDIGERNSDQPLFYKKVYAVVAAIPAGKLSTYGAVAAACGCPGGARAVGNALHHNKDTDKVPCHRVVRKNGHLGGYGGGTGKKKKILRKEGIEFKGDIVRDISTVFMDLKNM